MTLAIIVSGLTSDMRTSLLRPGELSEGQPDERVAWIPQRRNGIVPREQGGDEAECAAGFDPPHTALQVMADGKAQECEGKCGEEAEEGDRRAQGSHCHEESEDTPAYCEPLVD